MLTAPVARVAALSAKCFDRAVFGIRSRGDDDSIKLWDALTGVERATLPGHPMQTTGLAFSPDGRYLASVGAGVAVRLWDAATGTPVRRLRPGVGPLTSVVFAPDGKTVAVGSFSGMVTLMDVEPGAAKKLCPTRTAAIPDAATRKQLQYLLRAFGL